MLFCSLIFFVVTLFVSTVRGFDEEDGVLVLTDDNFSAAVEQNPNILVEFYAPWCGHCKSLAPEYAKAAKTLKNSPVKLAKVDATAEEGLAKQFEIRGFPTLKFFKNGRASEYGGGRTEKEIVSWLSKKIGPAATTLDSEHDLEAFVEANDVFVLGVFSSLEADQAKIFLSAADSDDLHIYAVSTSDAVRNKLGVVDNTAVVFKTFDEHRNEFAVEKETDVVKLVTKFSTPLIQEFSQQSSKSIFSSPIQQHVLFFTNKNAEYHDEIYTTYNTVAKSFQGEFLFVNIPSSETKVMEFFGISADQLPAAMLADLSNGSVKKYAFSSKHTTSDVSSFLEEFKAGTLRPTLKSEEPTADDVTSDVVVVKGKSFEEIVMDNEKDVLLEFYAPWCGHCKQLSPTWEELGKSLHGLKEKVIIAKIDATANEIDHPKVNVRGFPTIYFFPGNDKQNPVAYDGQRELDSFIDFLKANAHHGSSIKDEL